MVTPRRKARESDLQTQAMEKFAQAFPELKILRLNSGLAKSLHGGYTIHLAPKGTPDLVVPSPYIWVEMKRPGEELTPEQFAWQTWALENGVPHVVCDTPEDLIATVRRMLVPSAPEPPLTADRLRGLTVIGLKWHPSMVEQGYQDQFCEWLRDAGFKYEREHVLTAKDRVDFMVEGIAVEFKLKCSANETLRQLARYAQHNSVREILLVSATHSALQALPPTLNGKPVRGLHIGRPF